MSLLVVGTVPARCGEVVCGPVTVDDEGCVHVGGWRVPRCQGTGAMLGAAEAVTRHLGGEPPYALMGGDIGRGDGTRAAVARLPEVFAKVRPSVVVLHYMQPLISVMLGAWEALREAVVGASTRLVADAGGMYAAKAAGLAQRFELMTPDVGEIGFLADPKTTHPAYVTRFLLGADEFDPQALARQAAANGGSSRVLLVKGEVDYVLSEGTLVAAVREPDVPELEAIGGTGDTITGMAAAFMAAGEPAEGAALHAAEVNRRAGMAMGARPDKQAWDLIAAIPGVLAARPRC